jgi:transposase
VPADRDDEPVRAFKSFTDDLNALADWLRRCEVDTVAMESTGIYWIPLFELLESRGFTVYLVNARHVKNVSGRKSDVLDCQWLQQLMSYGLLSGAFRPKDEICALRAVSRQRDMLLAYQARHVQHMQKALAQMNVQLANVISDIVGQRRLRRRHTAHRPSHGTRHHHRPRARSRLPDRRRRLQAQLDEPAPRTLGHRRLQPQIPDGLDPSVARNHRPNDQASKWSDLVAITNTETPGSPSAKGWNL